MESRSPTRQNGPFKYDAYLGFGVSDLPKLNLLRDKLEQRSILCYPKYDAANRQQSIKSAIREGVARSKKCLLYVSDSFVDDPYYKYEVDEVLHKASRFSRDMVIVVVDPEVVMPAKLVSCTAVIYAVLDDSTLTDPSFLHKLTTALTTGTCMLIHHY